MKTDPTLCIIYFMQEISLESNFVKNVLALALYQVMNLL